MCDSDLQTFLRLKNAARIYTSSELLMLSAEILFTNFSTISVALLFTVIYFKHSATNYPAVQLKTRS